MVEMACRACGAGGCEDEQREGEDKDDAAHEKLLGRLVGPLFESNGVPVPCLYPVRARLAEPAALRGFRTASDPGGSSAKEDSQVPGFSRAHRVGWRRLSSVVG